MAAFIVGTIRVRDPEAWQRYVEQVGATFGPFGGEVVFRAGDPIPLSGAAHGERIVVARFPDLGALRRWHDSAQYQALVPLREAGAEVVLTAYQA